MPLFAYFGQSVLVNKKCDLGGSLPRDTYNSAAMKNKAKQHIAKDESGISNNSLIWESIGELIGTYILVFIGLGAGHLATSQGYCLSIWQIGLVWFVAVVVAIYSTRAIAGVHINSAVTLAFVVFGKTSLRRAPFYIISQLVGAFLAAATLYLLFNDFLAGYESAIGVTRGGLGSERSAMFYCEFFPNPSFAESGVYGLRQVTMSLAMLAEVLGTALLLFSVFLLADPRIIKRNMAKFTPVLIGLVVAVIICGIVPFTQACLNPARDFGPRLFAYLAGWGSIAIPGPRGGYFAVYILSPIIGALLGSVAYKYIIGNRIIQP